MNKSFSPKKKVRTRRMPSETFFPLSSVYDSRGRSFSRDVAERGGHWIFGFAVLAIFRSVFRFLYPKTSVFRFWCSLRLADFPFLNIWFSVSAKNTDGFSDLISDTVSGFSLFDLFGFRFLFDLSGNYAPPLISNSR